MNLKLILELNWIVDVYVKLHMMITAIFETRYSLILSFPPSTQPFWLLDHLWLQLNLSGDVSSPALYKCWFIGGAVLLLQQPQ